MRIASSIYIGERERDQHPKAHSPERLYRPTHPERLYGHTRPERLYRPVKETVRPCP